VASLNKLAGDISRTISSFREGNTVLFTSQVTSETPGDSGLFRYTELFWFFNFIHSQEAKNRTMDVIIKVGEWRR
jgi:hypothetical protein